LKGEIKLSVEKMSIKVSTGNEETPQHIDLTFRVETSVQSLARAMFWQKRGYPLSLLLYSNSMEQDLKSDVVDFQLPLEFSVITEQQAKPSSPAPAVEGSNLCVTCAGFKDCTKGIKGVRVVTVCDVFKAMPEVNPATPEEKAQAADEAFANLESANPNHIEDNGGHEPDDEAQEREETGITGNDTATTAPPAETPAAPARKGRKPRASKESPKQEPPANTISGTCANCGYEAAEAQEGGICPACGNILVIAGSNHNGHTEDLKQTVEVFDLSTFDQRDANGNAVPHAFWLRGKKVDCEDGDKKKGLLNLFAQLKVKCETPEQLVSILKQFPKTDHRDTIIEILRGEPALNAEKTKVTIP
jgi:hypothetical protein